MASVTGFRLTFIWTETILDAFTGKLPASQAGLPCAVGADAYKSWFDAAQANWPERAKPTPPWPAHRHQNFWARYLQAGESLKGVTGAVAWRNAVPVLLPAPFDVAFDGDARVHAEGLAHPWGVTFVLNISWPRFPGTLADVTREVVETRRGKRFVLGGQKVTLDRVGAEGLTHLREQVMGPGHAGPRTPEPLSIFAAIRGEGTRDDLDPSTNEDVHRLVQASTSFSQTYDWDALVVLDSGRVAGRKYQPSSHIVFGSQRGRAIWGPAYLAKTHVKATVGCQLRNLVFASAQTESLARFAAETMEHVSRGGRVAGDLEAAARRAMAVLGQLYLGKDSTYKTGSVKAQVDANGFKPAIEQLRARLGLEPL
jgi:hypothetical protein